MKKFFLTFGLCFWFGGMLVSIFIVDGKLEMPVLALITTIIACVIGGIYVRAGLS